MSQLRVGITAEQLLRPTPGGIGTYTEQLLRSYRRNFGVPIVLSSKPSGAKEHMISELGDVHVAPFGAHLTGRLWELGALRLPKSLRCLDVVHATSFHFPDVHSGKSVKDSHPRLSVFIHDLAWIHHPEFFSPRGRSFHRRGLERTARNAHWVLVPSARTKGDLIANGGIEADRITVVGEGADHLPTPGPQRQKPEKPYLLTVSTIEPRKNLDGLLRAYEIVRNRIGNSCPELLVVGPKGWSGDASNARIVPTVGVEFVGAVGAQRLADLYADALGFVYVPHLEGFGLPPIEAMRAGVPVLASTAVPSIDGDFDHSMGDPAILVAATDTNAIADALQRLIEDPTFRNDYAHRGQQFAQSFTWDAVVRRHHALWATGTAGERT
jgi:glycosyltransferase involved in cell wall biosynthesis